MTETIKVKILADGKTAKEMNKLEKASPDDVASMGNEFRKWKNKKWKETEAKLRTFEVDFGEGEVFHQYNKKTSAFRYADTGTVHSAKILKNGRIKIV